MVAFMIQPVDGECCAGPCVTRTDPCDPCETCDCDPEQAQVSAEQHIGASTYALGTFTWQDYFPCRYESDAGTPTYSDMRIYYSEATTKWTFTYDDGGTQIYSVASTGCGAGPAATYVDDADPSNDIVVTLYP